MKEQQKERQKRKRDRFEDEIVHYVIEPVRQGGFVLAVLKFATTITELHAQGKPREKAIRW